MENTRAPSDLPFMKMHGLGNDFVVIDARSARIEVTPALARALGDRRSGGGIRISLRSSRKPPMPTHA